MAYILNLKSFTDERGNLTVIEKNLPFDIKRVFYIYGVDGSVRGGHRHKKTIQAAVCIQGKCTVYTNNNHTESEFNLDTPSKCLILQPEDWHKMYHFTKDAILMVFASEFYDYNDYVFEAYSTQ